MSKEEKSLKDADFNKWTVKQLRAYCKKQNLKIPSKARKADIVKVVKQSVSNLEFPENSQNESQEYEKKKEETPTEEKVKEHEEQVQDELEEEIIAGFDEEDDPALLNKVKMDAKFWQQPEFRVLLDFELAKDSKTAFYDLSHLVDNFFNNMLQEEFINYKISGIALKSAANLHHYKISSIIKQEEQIQKNEELKKIRERHSRSIPKALPQPIQPKLQIATKEELYEAMRAAIIETMQKKEKLKRRRIRKEELQHKKKQIKSKARLPKELLKHISGKEQTIGELHESWLKRIKATAKMNNTKETYFFELMDLIKNDESSSLGRKFALVRMFLALMFLSTSGASGTGSTLTEIELSQEEDFKNIHINLK